MSRVSIQIFSTDTNGNQIPNPNFDPNNISAELNGNPVTSTWSNNGDSTYYSDNLLSNGSGNYTIKLNGSSQDEWTNIYLAGEDSLTTGSLDGTSLQINGSGKAEVVDYANILKKADVVDDLVTGGSDVPLSADQGVFIDSNFVKTADIVNDLTTGGTAVPLSAQQGVVIDSRLDTVEAEVSVNIRNPKVLTGNDISTLFTQTDDALWQLRPSNNSNVINETVHYIYQGASIADSASLGGASNYGAAGSNEYTPSYRLWRESSKSSYVIKWKDKRLLKPNQNTAVCNLRAYWTGSGAAYGKFRFYAENVSGSVQRDSPEYIVLSVSNNEQWQTLTLDISDWSPGSTIETRLYMVASESVDFSADNYGMEVYTTNLDEQTVRLNYGMQVSSSVIQNNNQDAV